MKTAHVPILRLPARSSAACIEGIRPANRRARIYIYIYIYDICTIIRPILISACQFLPSIKERSRSGVDTRYGRMVCGLWRGVIESGIRKRAGPCIQNSETRRVVGHVERLLIRDKTLVRPLLSIHPRREHDILLLLFPDSLRGVYVHAKSLFESALEKETSAQGNTKVRGHRE